MILWWGGERNREAVEALGPFYSTGYLLDPDSRNTDTVFARFVSEVGCADVVALVPRPI